MATKRFVILDRDGTIIIERVYLADQNLVELLPNVTQGLHMMRSLGLGLVIVTNQSAIERGYLSLAGLDLIHARMLQMLAAEGLAVDGIFFCPHLPERGCSCRKPGTEMVEKAARSLGFNPAESFVIGDKPCDIELGQRMSASTFLVRTGYGAQEESINSAQPDYIVDDLLGAATIIKNIL